jgi:hypothetical protein
MPVGYDASEGYTVEIDGRGYTIRPRMLESLNRWISNGILPGGFLRGVIRNDFYEALTRADADNLANIRAYAHWLWWEAPSGSWGSVEDIRKWQAKFTIEEEVPCR